MIPTSQAKQAREDVAAYKEALRWNRRWYQFMPRQMLFAGERPMPTEKDNDYYEVFFGSQLGKFRGAQVIDKAKMMKWNRGIDAKQWYRVENDEFDNGAPPIPVSDERPIINIYKAPPPEQPPKEKDKKVKKEARNFLGVTTGLRLLRPNKKKREENEVKKLILPKDYKLDLHFADNVFPENFDDFVLEKLKNGEKLEGNYKSLYNTDKKEREIRLEAKQNDIKRKEGVEKERMTLEKLGQQGQTVSKTRYVRDLENEKGYIDEDELKPRYGPGTGKIYGSNLGGNAGDKPTRLLFLFLQEHPEFSNNDHSTNLFTEQLEKFKEEHLKKNNYRNDFI